MRIDSSGVIWAAGIYTNTATSPNRDVYVGYNGKLGYLSSIRESKTNIAPVHDVDWLYQLAPVTFNYRTKDEADNYTDEFSNETEYGLIAEEVETVAPDLCFYDEIDGNQELRGVSYRKLITPLLAALQQSNQRIKTLEQRLCDAGIA
ncbi:MAG: tail fiber domain-containing protein [Tateyamaria sp.]|nr:tail fiber domain-containing protein [Tateyamaria sp.]